MKKRSMTKLVKSTLLTSALAIGVSVVTTDMTPGSWAFADDDGTATSEHSCGEGSCGEKDATEETEDDTASDKGAESSCGEGTCGA